MKVLSIWVLAVEGVEFVIGVKLTVSFLRALARRFINWKGYQIVVVSGGDRGFSASSTLT